MSSDQMTTEVSPSSSGEASKARESYSQRETRQDIHVVDFFKGKTGGYFVDVGAYDGITMSNSYLLEKRLGWGGVCVEPDPLAFQTLKTIRDQSVTKMFCCAAFDDSGAELEFVQASKSRGLLSGLVKTIDKYQDVLTDTKIKVPTMGLTKILDEAGAPSVMDYLSLDTEGSEFVILRALDMQKYKFRFVSVEHNFVYPKRALIRGLMERSGYVYIIENNWDDYYIYPGI